MNEVLEIVRTGNAVPIELTRGRYLLLPDMPFNNLHSLQTFDVDLTRNEEMRQQFEQKVQEIGGKTLQKAVKYAMELVMTDELCKQTVWILGADNMPKLSKFMFPNIIISMDPNTEIRKLKPAEMYTLARILATSDSWKTLMAVIPKEGTRKVSKFNSEHFALVERASVQQRKPAAEILLEEWSTMGRHRPTLQYTLKLLVKAQLFRAADYIAVDLLQEQRPLRPKCGPAAEVEISDETIASLMKNANSQAENSSCHIWDSVDSMDSVLDGIGYPSGLSVERSLKHNEQVQNVSTENSSQYGSRYKSDLIQFTGNNAECTKMQRNTDIDHTLHYIRNNDTNLMQFSSDSIHSTKHTDQTMRVHETILSPSSECTTSIDDVRAQAGLEIENVIQSKFLNCVATCDSNERIITDIFAQKNDQGIRPTCNKNFSPKAISRNTSIFVENYCNDFALQPSKPAVVVNTGSESTDMYELKSSELPQVIVEITQKISNPPMALNAELYSESRLSKRFVSSEKLRNYLTDVTSFSDNNAANNTPICVDFVSSSSNNHELVAAEFPQFVADFKQRRRHDSSSHFSFNDAKLDLALGTSNNAPQADNESFIEQFFNQTVGSSNASSNQYLAINSQEIPLVVSECNRIYSSLVGHPKEMDSAELPQFIAELHES